MAIAVRQSKSVDSTGGLLSSPVSVVFDSAVAAGSLLVLAGVALYNDTYTFSNCTSVTDTQGNTWQSPANVNAASSPSVFFTYAMNAAAGATTLTVNLSNASNNRVSLVAFEVTGAATASTLDLTVNGTSSALATSVATATSATLAQADNWVLLVGGGAFGVPSTTSGYTDYLSISNGGNKIGSQIMARVVAATTALTGTVNHESTANPRHALLAVFKAAAATVKRYKFELDSAAFTSSDTGITGYVWRNVDPDTGTAEKYTGLEGSSTAGVMYITSTAGVPQTASTSDSIAGIFYNSSDTSGLISGTVEEV